MKTALSCGVPAVRCSQELLGSRLAQQHGAVGLCRRIANVYLSAFGDSSSKRVTWRPISASHGVAKFGHAHGVVRIIARREEDHWHPILRLYEPAQRRTDGGQECHVRALECVTFATSELGGHILMALGVLSVSAQQTLVLKPGPSLEPAPSPEQRWVPHFPGVFHPNNIYGARLQKVALPLIDERAHVLVLGTGSGIDAVRAAQRCAGRVDAVDICPFAVANTKAMAVFFGLEHRICAWHSDGLANVRRLYDVVLFNAPRAVSEAVPNNVTTFDPNGQLLRRVLATLPRVLAPGGAMYLMADPDLSSYLPHTLRHEILHCEDDVDVFAGERRKPLWNFAIHRITVA